MLDPAGAFDPTERRFHMPEDRAAARGETHVAGQREFTACTPGAALDLGDGDEPAGAQIAEEKPQGRFAGELRGAVPVFGDPVQVDVGDEVIGVSALEHDHADVVVGLRLLDEGDKVSDQFGSDEIQWRRRDIHEEDAAFTAHRHCLKRPQHGYLLRNTALQTVRAYLITASTAASCGIHSNFANSL